MKYKILVFAPYQELSDTIKLVGSDIDDVELTIYNADLSEATKILSQLNENDFDAIISRGGTADLLKTVTSLPVIDISISLYDILKSIKLAQNYTDRFVIIAHKSITEEAHLLCDILDYKIQIYTIKNEKEASEVLNMVKKEKYDLILCDSITNKLAILELINTILITSGVDSIKQALDDTLQIAKKINVVKTNLSLLERFNNKINNLYLILDNSKNILLSNLEKSLKDKIIDGVLEDLPKEDSRFRFMHKGVSYTLFIEKIQIKENFYYIAEINPVKSQIINNKFGLSILSRDEVKKHYYDNINNTIHISETIKNNLLKFGKHYSSTIVWGQKGTSKTSIAYYLFLNQVVSNKTLITLNTALLNNRMWKYLLNVNDGPLLSEGITLIFKNFELISKKDLEKLFTVIHNTGFLSSNKIIFIINAQDSKNTSLINTIISNLNSANIYVESLNERKSELASLLTQTVNRLNVECSTNIIGFEPKALEELIEYEWPGNISQMNSILKELVLNTHSHYISYRNVVEILEKQKILNHLNITNNDIFKINSTNMKPTLEDYNKFIINQVLEKNDGNKSKTSEELGISRTTLWRILNSN
ncbi:sigma-54-dependent Fis family transcriptional regulator [Helcococcus kunzii]|uniref:sigma-54-dependent Fis family transcriptional regulator n=1 Tax=Helcococcus kunzii TaxID=40091 RepID=UPI001BB0152F|nr:PrpR N-terminal domain-containing protein [Helcococcus kunzii]QUY64051.1 sigma-54-dependent transcriptional regulator [Helcococcus kunzii]